MVHSEKNKRANRVNYNPPKNGCHIELFLLCSGRRSINGGSSVGAEKQNNELGGLTPISEFIQTLKAGALFFR